MKITILGCGSSGGLPLIGNDWGACDPLNEKNRRTRASILIEQADTKLLVDTSPDLREQLLRANVQKLTAVLYTHAHADHCHGIDDLRAMNWRMQAPIDIYGDAQTIEKITTRFDYIFNHREEAGRYYKPSLTPHIIHAGKPLQFGDLTVLPFEQDHTYVKTLGFRIGTFAYTTDAKALNDEAFEMLQGLDVWVVDCVGRKPHPTHSHLEQTLAWIERTKPKKAYLTHMGQGLDYEALCAELPGHIRPAYDGLSFNLT
ncbi:MAG: MBL fold metallo-hydrolase [Alphaproteobacteria bacterium]|nr:MBL fold metallo-hydrolase [Alphaproteobacteria bacterium]